LLMNHAGIGRPRLELAARRLREFNPFVDEHLIAAVRYLALNPVKAKLAARAEAWRWMLGLGVVPAAAVSAPAGAAPGKLRWVAVAIGGLALFSLLAAMAGRRAAVAISWVLLTLGAAMLAFKGVPAAWSLVPRAGAGAWSMGQAGCVKSARRPAGRWVTGAKNCWR